MENKEYTKLNMGCGFKKHDNHLNVDISPVCNPDQVLDLNITPWPYKTDTFTHILADNILEHLGKNPENFTEIIKEMYRVSKHGAEWYIKVPHHRCDLQWDDYTHVRVLTEKTFRMFDQQTNFSSVNRGLSDSTFGFYNNVDLEVVDVKYNIINYWKEQLQKGLIGHEQFNVHLNTLCNVAECVEIFIKVHKPGRFEQWLKDKKNTG